MYNENISSSVINCTFSANTVRYSGGGMFNGLGSPTITGCVFSANHAGESGGGMANERNSSKVTNCTFSANTAKNGGGGVSNQAYYDKNAEPVFINCTFAKNTAAYGGGMYNVSDTTSYVLHTNIYNSVFYGNSASNDAEIGSDGNANTHVTVTDCVVKDGYPSGTNITSEDPKLSPLDKKLSPTTISADVYVYAISGDSSALQFGAPVGTKVSGDMVVPSDDQTGLLRKSGVSADVGSYSYNIEKLNIPVVSIDPVSASITVGTSKPISLKPETAMPDAVFNGTLWTSSNEDIASVKESGKGVLVKALKEGKAIITATIGNIGPRSETLKEVSLSADITVKPAPTPTGGSSGGCSAGFAALALLAVIPVVLKKKK